MDEVNEKAIERMGDILDAIKTKVNMITSDSSPYDTSASETILNLTHAFDLLYRNVR